MLTTENLFIRCVRLPIINILKLIIIMAFGKDFFGTLAEGAVNAATGGLLGVGLDAISGAINNKYQKQMIDYQVDAQKDLQDYAYEQQLDFWNKQNEYNDPSAMVNRLRQAGLNPAMLNGNAAVNQAGNLSSISTPSAPQGGRQSTNSVAAMTSLASIAQSMAQTGFLDEQAKLMTQKILSELLEQNIKEIAALTGMSEAELKRMDAEATYEAYYGTGIDGGPLRIKNNPVTLAMEAKRQEIASGEAQEDYTRALETTEHALRDLRQDQLYANIAESKQRVKTLDAEAKKLLREADSIEQIYERRDLQDCASAFFGFQIHDLPATLQQRVMALYTSVVRGAIYPETAIRSVERSIEEYRDKELHIPRTRSQSFNESNSSLFGLYANSEGYSWTEVY